MDIGRPGTDFAPHAQAGRCAIVIPVRYVAGPQVVHATSSAVSVEDADIRTAIIPKRGTRVGLKLFFPFPGGIITRDAVVAETSPGCFRARFETNEAERRRLGELLWRREMTSRPCPRFHTQIEVTVRESTGETRNGVITNISRSGAFLRLEKLPATGSVVQVDLVLPGQSVKDSVHAFVVHVADRRGVGVQFIGGGDAFIAHLEAWLAQLEGEGAAGALPRSGS
jgi:hypothetical protein